ncbi:SpoIID/LytB domain-containing protein [Nocardia sp. NPDC050412]|uniref:SpoIID/LytB domain-containing protein n=1 Tax=Nocardia sp. NPDC050412 TaxID=3364320 RepID=UPI00378D6DFC
MLVTGGAAVLVGTVLAFWVWPGDAHVRPMAGPGHGRGMSQVGAFDSALEGWAAERILDHYYPGATLGKISATTVGVRLFAQDDSTLDAYADAGLRVAGQMLPRGQVAHLTALPDGGANVVVTAGCDGEVLWQRATADPWIYPLNPRPNRPAAEHLTLCGGSAYRGSLGVAMENGKARTVNRVDVEDYLLGVVPAEVQANWVDKGATEALRAQAIAARSYALAEHRYSYAQTCDSTDCQEYPGTAKEDPRATAVIASTAGTVLLRDGRILRSEYSCAPDGGEPADIYAFDVGPTPAELGIPVVGAATPVDPRKQSLVAESPIDAEYRRIGGASSPVGQPLGPELALPQNAGTYRLFTNGVIIATPTLGAQVVDFTTLMQLVPDTREDKPRSTAPPGSNERATPPGANSAPKSAVPDGGASGLPESVLPGSAAPPGANGAPSSVLPGGNISPEGALSGGANGAPESAVPGSVLPGGDISREGALSGGANGALGSAVPGSVLPGGDISSEGALSGGANGAPESVVPGSALPGGDVSSEGALSGGANGAPESVVPRSALSGGDVSPESALSGGADGAADSAGLGDVASGSVLLGGKVASGSVLPGGHVSSESALLGSASDAVAGRNAWSEGAVAGGNALSVSAVPGRNSPPGSAAPGNGMSLGYSAAPGSAIALEASVPPGTTVAPTTASTPTPPPPRVPVIPSAAPTSEGSELSEEL